MAENAWSKISARMADSPSVSGGAAHTVIDLVGDPRDNGRIHGELARAQILHNVIITAATIKRGSQGKARMISRMWEILEKNAAFVRSQNPDIAEEIVGIAEGAGISERDAWSLAVPVHVMLRAIDQECSQVLVMGHRSEGTTPIMAKSRDFHGGQEYQQVFLRHRYSDGTVVAAMHTAGSITYPGIGVTSRGVAFSTSGVFSPFVSDDTSRADRAWIAFNSAEIARQATSAAHFEQLCGDLPRFRGINIVVADTQSAMTLELTRDRVVPRTSTDDFLQLTNHYQADDEELQALTPRPEHYASTYERAACARTALSGAIGWGVVEVAELMASHDGYPNSSICRHLDEGNPESKGQTVAVGIADVGDFALYGTQGHACEAGTRGLPPTSTR